MLEIELSKHWTHTRVVDRHILYLSKIHWLLYNSKVGHFLKTLTKHIGKCRSITEEMEVDPKRAILTKI